MILFCVNRLCGEPVVPTDEPVDREFVRQIAQVYYDAVAGKDFRTTATREVFVLQPTKPDLVAYGKAMQKHPYAGAGRIEFAIADLGPDRAYLDVKVHVNGGVIAERNTWSRTGTPKQWVVQATTMTLAGMPGHSIITEDDVPSPKEPVVTSTVVVRDRNPQDGVIAEGNSGPVQFVRPPKVMPAGKTGVVAYVLGSLENTGQKDVTGIAVNAVVRAEDGTVLETREFRPAKPSLAPGATVQFSGTLDHLAPKQTEFRVELEAQPGNVSP